MNQDATERHARPTPGPNPAVSTSAMSTVIARVYELLLLTETDMETLAQDAASRADKIRQAMRSPSPEVREFLRVEARGLAEYDFHVGRLTDIGAGGLGVSTVRPLDVGTATRVSITDPGNGCVYAFPCVVVWSRAGEDGAMGLRFAGPARLAQRHLEG